MTQLTQMTQRSDNIIVENDTIDTVDTGANSNTSKDIRARVWVFTYNNWTECGMAELKQFFIEEGKKVVEYVYQPEVGENGTPHIQGFIHFKNARTFKSLKKTFPQYHWEKARNIEAAKQYCKKTETAVGPSVSNKPQRRPLRDPLEGKEPYSWQQEIIDLIKTEPNDRTINWFYDLQGGKGKTSLAKHLCMEYPNQILYLSGSAKDCKYGVVQFLENDSNDLVAAIFDFERTVESFEGTYQALEAIKNGIFYNTKYESKMVVFNCPHVICFANWKPDESKLSSDRWRIINIGDEEEFDNLE